MTFNPQQWNTTTVDNGGNSDAPDPGTYEVLLTDGKAFTSKAGNDTVVIELRVATGPAAGHEWSVLGSFRDEKATRATKTIMARLGMSGIDEIASLDEFDTRLKELVGNWYTVDVVQNGEWRNTYFNGKVDNTPPAPDVPADTSDFQPAAAGGAKADDDIPF